MSVLTGWLEQGRPAPPQGPEFGGSSPIGLVVVLLLAVALVFLIRSMNKHLRKVPSSFESTDESAQPADTPTEEPRPKEDAGASNGTDGDGKPNPG